ncbi:MAG: hypothetical protein ABJ251_11770 [Paracoccaceae bacterium]
MLKSISVIVVTVCWSWTFALAEPMSFRRSGSGGNCNGCEWIAAQGEITEDTPRVFREFLDQQGSVYHIALNSPGGNLLAGIRLGELIRKTGATTFVSETVQVQESGLEHLEEMSRGICASSCVFAFMGGVERFVGPDDQLGVHQFYSPDSASLDSEVTQMLAGATLFHTLAMGVDPRVIVAASGTKSDDIYWFDQQDLEEFGLDTSEGRTEPWRLEPYNEGIVLTTSQHDSVRRSVSVTLFCRSNDHQWRVLISEESAHHARQMKSGDFFGFGRKNPSRPLVSLGSSLVNIHGPNVEFQRISGDFILVSIGLPLNLVDRAKQVLKFDPDFPRVRNALLSVNVELPNSEWLSAARANCI